jgi:PAS domain S-box-containing protein
MIDDRPAVDEPFHLLVDGVAEYAIFMLDPSGAVMTWNAGARRIKGYDEAEIIGRHYSVFFVNDDVAADKPRQLLHHAVVHRRALDEGWRVRKDGSRFWANVVLTALFDGGGEVQGFADITRDDTDRRAADMRARQLDAGLDHERIARGLNDDVITRIYRAGLVLESLRAVSQDPRHSQHIDRAVDELDHAINDLRGIVLDAQTPHQDTSAATRQPKHGHDVLGGLTVRHR